MSVTPSHDRLTDVRVMGVIHSVYRREHRLAGGLVRGVADGDVVRARVVADHLTWLANHLHRHHSLEDEMLWPLLLERVADDVAPVVHLMEGQHRVVDALQTEVAEVLPRWRERADAATRERIAALLDRLYVHLVEHLDAEEQRLLPLAARAVHQAEWDAMGEIARRRTPRGELPLDFGMLAHDGDPEVVRGMLAAAPPPVRVLVPWLGRRAFRAHARRVHGTPSP